jgi:hypothetical protein
VSALFSVPDAESDAIVQYGVRDFTTGRPDPAGAGFDVIYGGTGDDWIEPAGRRQKDLGLLAGPFRPCNPAVNHACCLRLRRFVPRVRDLATNKSD